MPGCNLTVDDGKNGFVIQPRNVPELMKSIQYFLDNTMKISEFGKKSKEKFLNEFADNIVYDNILNTYENIMLN